VHEPESFTFLQSQCSPQTEQDHRSHHAPRPEAREEDLDYKGDTWTQEARLLVAGLDHNVGGNYPPVPVILQTAKTEGTVSMSYHYISPCLA